jgi:serine/threonine-protein kinase
MGVTSKELVVAAVESYVTAPLMVGRYLLYGEIASGGMASVHFGRLVGPAGFARPVAIKRLHAQFARDPDFVKMFLDEARLAARIAHPNVVPTLDVVNVKNEVFIVMEYVRGVSLSHLARTLRDRNERIQPLVALGIVSGMLQGLHAAHEARNDLGEPLNLVHRDVSPQNALVGTDGVTRLLDFGVAKAVGRLATTREGQLKGKLAYMAPEQVRGEQVTRRTDIYAASVVLWEALTGKRLFQSDNEANILANVLGAEVPAPSSLATELPSSLDRIVLRGLDRDPEKRYATAREMAAEVDACIGIASATEIGDWVLRIAGDELAEHARRIGSMERAAVSPESPTGVMARSDAETNPGRGSDRPTTASGRATRPERRAVADRRTVPLVFAGFAIVTVVAILVFVRAPSKQGVPVPAASEAPLVEGHPSALQEPVSPIATASVSEGPVPDSSGSASAPAAAASAGAAHASPSVPSKPTPNGSSGAARRPKTGGTGDCNPPYTVDAKGHFIFKPNCL